VIFRGVPRRAVMLRGLRAVPGLGRVAPGGVVPGLRAGPGLRAVPGLGRARRGGGRGARRQISPSWPRP